MKKVLVAAACLMLALLSACQGSKSTDIEKLWKAARKADSMEAYMKEQLETQNPIEETALETLQAQDATMEQQLQATALLCAAEYQSYLSEKEDGSWEEDLFEFDYSKSASYADSFLAKVNTEEEAFWTSMEEAFYPYDCLMPIFAAADNLEGQTLIKLASDAPEEGTLGTELEDAVQTWIEKHPGNLAKIGDELMEGGYFDDWSPDDWRGTYFYSSLAPDQVKTANLEDALTYLNYIKNSVLPTVEGKHGEDSLKVTSEITQEDYYESRLTVTIEEPIELQEKSDSGDEEQQAIETEGKKIIALYRNPQTEEFPGSPTPLRLMGDFMLELTEEEYPVSVEEADYYLVLTANYEEGGFYQTPGGNDTAVQEMNSSTSVDLYEAGTGAFLHHLGNVFETAPESIFTSYDDTDAQYPELAGADVLLYMYHNINEPEAYASLVDHLAGKSEMAIDEPVTLAGWEVTYHSAEIVKEFEDSMYVYTASDGCQFVKGKFTITNKGLEGDTFLPMVYYVGEDPLVQVTDESHENFYDCVNAITYSKCLNNTSLDPGESKDGELFFEVPDEVIEGGTSLYIAVSLGNRMVYYPLS